MKVPDIKIFDALPSKWYRCIEASPLWGFMPLVALLVVNALFVFFSQIDATWQVVLDQTQGLALCLGIYSTGAACYKKFKTALILSALKWIGSSRSGYIYTSTIQALMNYLCAISQSIEIHSIQVATRIRFALGIVHPSLFARLIPTPIFRRA